LFSTAVLFFHKRYECPKIIASENYGDLKFSIMNFDGRDIICCYCSIFSDALGFPLPESLLRSLTVRGDQSPESVENEKIRDAKVVLRQLSYLRDQWAPGIDRQMAMCRRFF